MSLNIIPSNIQSLSGEKKQIIQMLKDLYDKQKETSFLYVNPKIKNLRPDFLMVIPHHGVALLNVSGIREHQISEINRKQIKTMDGTIYDNPAFRSTQNHQLCKALFESDDRLYNKEGYLLFKVVSFAIFLNLSSNYIGQQIEAFAQAPTRTITIDKLKSGSGNILFGTEDIVDFDEGHVNLVRSCLFPEIKIHDVIKDQESGKVDFEFDGSIANKFKSLDSEQENFAKRLPFGHYMVTGVPGSGKTVILLSRALYLVKEHPDWQVLVVTYNRSLATKLDKRLGQFKNEFDFMGINVKNIKVKTFHRLALDLCEMAVPQNADVEFWNIKLPQQALQSARPVFEAVLIDEYQDFYDDWIRVCIKLCKKMDYTNTSGEASNGINLFLAGDRLQSIYNEREVSWAQLGIDMRGRSKLLKKTYRTGKEHINAALDFLMAEPSLAKEVESFYESRLGIENEAQIINRIEYIEGDYQHIAHLLDNLLLTGNFKSDDILILCHDKFSAEKVHSSLSEKTKSQVIVSNKPVEGKTTITTYHSAKGLEALICIMVDTDRFPLQKSDSNEILQRKLFYVGMTRASQYLYLHANSFNEKCFGGMVKAKNS